MIKKNPIVKILSLNFKQYRCLMLLHLATEM